MSCDRYAALLMPLADRELGRLRALRVSRHLAVCDGCATEHRALVALGARVRREVPRYRAPTDLVDALRAVHADAKPTSSPRERWRWGSVGALAGSVLTVVVWLAATAALDWRSTNALAARLVTAHVQAVGSGTLVAVASSDRHRVKPWLSARLDYAPPVLDLASDGFPLVGARIEIVDGQSVATLVYGFRDHTIDVFVRPAADGLASDRTRTVRGFNVVNARGQAMDWIGVSDAAAPLIADLLRRLAQPPDAPP